MAQTMITKSLIQGQLSVLCLSVKKKINTGNRRRMMIVMMIVERNLSYAGLVGVTTTCWEKSLCLKFLWEKQG
jgi:hypothetical protein